MIDVSQITLAVLAGGRGERMGRSKADLKIRGFPILQYLLEQWRWPGPTMLITAPGREHPPGASVFDAEHCDLMADPSPLSATTGPASAGPLRGLLTALTHAPTPQLVVTLVDMPGVRLATLQWISARLNAEPTWLGVMLSHGAAVDNQLEPFPFACRTAARTAVEARLAGERRSVIGLGQLPGFAVLPAPADSPADTWTNLNSPGDYAAFIASLAPPAL